MSGLLINNLIMQTNETWRRIKSFLTLLGIHLAVVALGALAVAINAPTFKDFIVSLGLGSVTAGLVANVLYQIVAFVLNKLSVNNAISNGTASVALDHAEAPTLI